jgi:hypothetical protein
VERLEEDVLESGGGSTDMNSWRMTVLGFLSKELTVDLVFRRKSR